jgi:hypothetical protein
MTSRVTVCMASTPFNSCVPIRERDTHVTKMFHQNPMTMPRITHKPANEFTKHAHTPISGHGGSTMIETGN